MVKYICLISVLAGVSLITACAPPPRHVALTTEDKAKLQGAKMIGVSEAPANFDHHIQKRAFVAYGGGLIGAAVALTATAVSAAVENAASEIDQMPVLDVDVAARVEAAVGTKLAEETGLLFDPDTGIADPKREFGSPSEGISKITAAAKAAGHNGPVLDVRSVFTGIVSSGIRAGDNPETFWLVSQMTARVIDTGTGKVIAKSECDGRESIGTMARFNEKKLSYAKDYADAVAAQDAAASVEQKRDEDTSDNLASKPLPAETYLSDLENRIVGNCTRTLMSNLI